MKSLGKAPLILSIALLGLFSIAVKASDLLAQFDNFTSVDDAVMQITNTLEKKGYHIPLLVNHAAAAASVGLELRPTQVIFARQPRALERSQRRSSDTLALDLPTKILVFEDESGDIQVRANSIGYLIDRHEVFVSDLTWLFSQLTTQPFASLNHGLITIPSQQSITKTVTALQAAISSNPAFRIPLVLEFCQYKKRHCPVLIVFGNPNAGTPLMQATQEVAIDLPQKFLVWKDSKQQVNITYNDPLFIAERHNLQGQSNRLKAIANALANFAKQGAGDNN